MTWEPDLPDEPGCPLLGLASDARTRCTYAHPRHRCHAAGGGRSIKGYYQVTVCLAARHAACDRYLAWEQRHAAATAAKGQSSGTRPGD
jgi:hypothetical protein